MSDRDRDRRPVNLRGYSPGIGEAGPIDEKRIIERASSPIDDLIGNSDMLTAANTHYRFSDYGSGGYDNLPMTAEPPIASVPSAPVAVPVAGGERIDLSPERLQGAWTLRFGPFGCPDSETRGGVVQIIGDAFVGGDENLAYSGTFRIEGSGLNGSVDIIRHGDTPDQLALFDTDKGEYRAQFVAEAITENLMEGRLRRDHDCDLRIVLRRLTFGRA